MTVIAVTTTGVYCRPGCPARSPRREHVVVFDGADDAEREGFRACRRCRKSGGLLRACEFIARHLDGVKLSDVAQEAGWSPFHLHRVFKQQLGVTPAQYARRLRFGRFAAAGGRVTAAILEHDKFPIVLGGEHSLTGAVVAAMAAKHPGLSVLQIDAHADLRDTYMGTRFNHACAMRRVLEHAPCTQVGIRSLSTGEAKAAPSLATTIFYDVNMRQDANWIAKVVESLGKTVYITIDVDGMDPAIMPATGTPEPGGLSWYEILSLLRAVIAARNVVGCDVVELSPLPGVAAPNFLCAKLVYKILTYQFAKK